MLHINYGGSDVEGEQRRLSGLAAFRRAIGSQLRDLLIASVLALIAGFVVDSVMHRDVELQANTPTCLPAGQSSDPVGAWPPTHASARYREPLDDAVLRCIEDTPAHQETYKILLVAL